MLCRGAMTPVPFPLGEDLSKNGNRAAIVHPALPSTFLHNHSKLHQNGGICLWSLCISGEKRQQGRGFCTVNSYLSKEAREYGLKLYIGGEGFLGGCIYSISWRSSATLNLAAVFSATCSTVTPGATSVKVRPPLTRSTWKTH